MVVNPLRAGKLNAEVSPKRSLNSPVNPHVFQRGDLERSPAVRALTSETREELGRGRNTEAVLTNPLEHINGLSTSLTPEDYGHLLHHPQNKVCKKRT